jgi:tRNA dimethylallyltransferase
VRRRLERELGRLGPAALYARLAARSPRASAAIEPTDRSRIVRALELLEMGEEPSPADEDSQLWTAATRRPTLLAALVMERAALYARIDARADALVAAGAAEEVRRAEAAGASRTARKALGYEELLAGEIDAMKRRSRNYARRQLTWMRKLGGVRVIDVTDREPEAVAAGIEALAGD